VKAFLGIAALILAIPTYGLSLIMLIGIIWYQGKSGNFDSSKKVAYRSLNDAVQKGEYREVQDKSSQKVGALLASQEFWYPVRTATERSGVPPVLVTTFSEQQMYQDLFFRPLLGSGVSNGLSLTELQMLCSDFISDFWNALSASQKRFVYQSHNSGDRYVNIDVLSAE